MNNQNPGIYLQLRICGVRGGEESCILGKEKTVSRDKGRRLVARVERPDKAQTRKFVTQLTTVTQPFPSHNVSRMNGGVKTTECQLELRVKGGNL